MINNNLFMYFVALLVYFLVLSWQYLKGCLLTEDRRAVFCEVGLWTDFLTVVAAAYVSCTGLGSCDRESQQLE